MKLEKYFIKINDTHSKPFSVNRVALLLLLEGAFKRSKIFLQFGQSYDTVYDN